MDLFQANRLREELAADGVTAHVITAPDLWDMPGPFQTVLYPVPRSGERELKIDMVDQAFDLLRPGGQLLVVSPFYPDQFFPGLLKKIYGLVHATQVGSGTVFWCHRDRCRRRRRHEITFHARAGDDLSLPFLSRPGVFAYGRMDEGARALLETMTIDPGDRILDLGCGCGTNGVFAGRRSGPDGRVVFVDSNVRAVALAELNARANGLAEFQTIASADGAELPVGGFDAALANPPYYAQGTIAQRFIERCQMCLRRGGRLYLVTKQADQVGRLVAESFGRTDVTERRGYVVLSAVA
jgi:16S rRNA (guanine1207-N2)-methyltransferase